MDKSKIPTRSEISESDKWDLTGLFADVGKCLEDFIWIQETYPRLKEWKGKLGASPQSLVDCLEFEKALELKLERLYHFASLQLAEDSANNEYLARIAQTCFSPILHRIPRPSVHARRVPGLLDQSGHFSGARSALFIRF